MANQNWLLNLNPILMLLGASLGYSYLVVRKVQLPVVRVGLLVPALYLFTLLPWYSSSAVFRGHLSYFVTWIASFKLLLLCFNRGPLFGLPFVDFVAVSIFPIKLKQPLPSGPPPLSVAKLTGGVIIISLITLNNVSIICGFYVFLLLFSWFPALGRYEVVPLFNKPYLATSLQDLWGRRWNLYSSSVLRQTVYYPTRNGLQGMLGLGPGPAKAVALISALAVSGIMHELMFYYITCGKQPTWEATRFFVLQALAMLSEAALKSLFRVAGRNPVHPAVSVTLTLGFVLATFYWLIAVPVQRSGQNQCELPSCFLIHRLES